MVNLQSGSREQKYAFICGPRCRNYLLFSSTGMTIACASAQRWESVSDPNWGGNQYNVSTGCVRLEHSVLTIADSLVLTDTRLQAGQARVVPGNLKLEWRAQRLR